MIPLNGVLMMKKVIFLVFLALGTAIWNCAPALKLKPGEQSEQSLGITMAKKENVRYLLYLPKGYPKIQKKWPMILFLHGAGERGDDLEKVKLHGPPKLIESGKSYPFIILSPQCHKDQWWSNDVLDALLRKVVKKYRIDQKRIYCTGLSMGGFGTWALAAEYPSRFAAIAPICGGGDTTNASVLRDIPAWVFHGAKDRVVPLSRSQEMVDALKKEGADVKFTVYPDADHDSWTATYENPELYEWFLIHKK